MQEAIAEVVPAEPTASSRKRGRDHVADADSTFNDRYSRLGDGRRVEARLSSQIGAVNGSRRQRDEQIPESTKPEIQQVYQQAEILNRNRRLFGSLMGHLGQARQKLEQDTEKIERQSQRVQEIKEKSERGAKLLEEEQRRKAHQEQVEVKIEAVSRLTEDWKRYMLSVSHFLFTETEPRLAWLPSSHNSTSRGLLDRRNDEVRMHLSCGWFPLPSSSF